MTNVAMEEAAEILLSMMRSDPHVYFDPVNRCFRPNTLLPTEPTNEETQLQYSRQQPKRKAPASALFKLPSTRKRLLLPEQDEPQDTEVEEVLTQPPSKKMKAVPVFLRDANTTQRKQQDFTPYKTDEAFEKQKPTKGERFCKNLAYHMSGKVNSPKKSIETAKDEYVKLEKYTTKFGPFRHQGTPSKGSLNGPNILGPNGLTQPENDFCSSLYLSVEKYRAMKARMIIGWACIIEQNLRGGSRRLRRCHPFLGGDDKYRCINLGSSQGQWLCRGYDANIASKVCRQLQIWGWLPNNSIFHSVDGVVIVIPEVEMLYPRTKRQLLLTETLAWDVAKGVPIENRMVIAQPDLLPHDLDATSEEIFCACKDKQHTVVNGFVLPQGTQACLRKDK